MTAPFFTSESPPLDLNSQHLYLEIAATNPTQPASFSTSAARRRAYLNQICLDTFLPWIREEQGVNAKVWPNRHALPSFWEVVNGSAIVANQTRLVFIPTEAIDLDQITVPQEWVDIPSWTADYYVLIQVDSDEDYIRIAGYTTHQQLKTQGQYNADDRTYNLDAEALISDINLLWLSSQFCAPTALRSAVPPLAPMAQTQADNLLNRLGAADVIWPRLAVPFALWAGLVEHGGWRQRLSDRRQGQAQQTTVTQWLQTGLSQLATQFGWQQGELRPVPLGVRTADSAANPYISRALTIAGNLYELRILSRQAGDRPIWRFELVSQGVIPAGVTLRLLTEDLQPFENNADTANASTTTLYVEVMLADGEGIVWEVEPMPEDYDREILWF
jgi:hypothetical protein